MPLQCPKTSSACRKKGLEGSWAGNGNGPVSLR